MSDSVLMPALGESVTEGTVTRWLKQVGDSVEVDEPLLEVSTDKVDTEIPSPFAGTLTEILVGEDETVEVGTALARIGAAGEGGSQDSGQGAEPEAAEAPAEQGAPEAVDDSGPSDTAVDMSEQQAAQIPPEVTGETGTGSGQAAPADAPQGGASGGDGPGQDVRMPALGESVTEGTVTRWLKQVGDAVEVDEALLEVSTDKVDTEIPSPFAGTLSEVLVGEDETVEVGTVLARIGGSGGSGTPAQPAEQQATSEQAAPSPQPGQDTQEPVPAQGEIGQDAASQQPNPLGAAQGQEGPVAGSGPDDGTSGGKDSLAQGASGDSSSQGGSSDGLSEGQASDTTAAAPEAPTQTSSDPVSAPEPSATGATNPAPGQAGDRASQTAQPAAPAGGGGTGYLTPLVRKLAAEKGVDLAGLTGTGVGGRIRKEDVLEAAAEAERRREQAEREKAEQAASAKAAASAPAQPAAAGGARHAQPAAGTSVSPLRGTTEKASRLRQVIASRMVESLQSMAQLTTVVEVDVTRVARLRARAKNDFAAREGVNLTFLPFFVLAATEALKAHPKVNGVLEGNQITYHGEENVGIAVDTPRGLVVPVIRGAGDLNLAGIARKIADLAARTRDNKVTPDELSGATFTVTNTGSGGALFDTPIVPVGTSAILGTGTIVKRPVVATDPEGGEYIAVRSMCYLALSYDHRLVDGADAARYLAAVKKRIEEGDFESEVGV